MQIFIVPKKHQSYHLSIRKLTNKYPAFITALLLIELVAGISWIQWRCHPHFLFSVPIG